MKKLGRVYARYALKREVLAPYAPYPRRVIPNLPAGIKLTINNHINKKIFVESEKTMPNWKYSFLRVLKQWGQAVTILFTPYFFIRSIFSRANI